MTENGEEYRFVRLLFTGLDGISRSLEITSNHADSLYEEGVYFDGSSVPGYAPIHDSDRLLMPVWDRPRACPWERDVGILLCSVYSEPGIASPGDPRHLVSSMSKRLHDMGLVLRIGCELEFFLVRNSTTGRIVPADTGEYMASYPADEGLHIRREIVGALQDLEVPVVAHHHEVAQGQHEIVLEHADARDAADNILLTRLVVSEISHRHGLTATFMPKPFATMNGSGLHLHQSLWDAESRQNLFALPTGGLSGMALSYVAGILEHAEALSALVAPTVNSYKRLKPFFEAPTTVAWGHSNRSSMIRVPKFSGTSSGHRIEMRCPDPSCSPHLAIAAIMAAGLDGLQRELVPAASSESNLFEDTNDARHLPQTLEDALAHLERNTALRESIGRGTIDRVVILRRTEWADYYAATGQENPEEISGWEIEKYLHAL